MPKAVTVIPATINPRTRMSNSSVEKRRVAAYARVSTDSDEQFTSYEAQIDYYTNYIKRNPEWTFVKVYTDEGISGLNTRHRDGFKEMVRDALSGRFDLIVTKSISRFARNTVDSLVTVRQLKEKNVEVFFEKENIYTFDSKGELLITIMSSLAQEESRSISENVTWGQRKRFADGKVSLPYKKFLGYRKGPDGLPEIVPEEAETVRKIYKMFIEGKTPGSIAKQLSCEGIRSPGGKLIWQPTTVESILSNEKYKGDALLQKKFTVDFLTKKTKRNEGEVPQYYVENSHPAIIAPEEWELVQRELARRKRIGIRYSGNNIFASKIVCGECGAYYGSKVWHSTDKYRKIIWRCNDKFKGGKCTSPNLDEDNIKGRFVKAINTLIDNRASIIEDCILMKQTVSDTGEIDAELEAALEDIDVVTELTRRCIEDNSRNAQSQEEYIQRYNNLVERYEAAKLKAEQLQEKKAEMKAKSETIGAFIKSLKGQTNIITEFDEKLWLTTIDEVVAKMDGALLFRFKNGMTVEV